MWSFSFQEYVDLEALEPQTPTSSEAPSSPRNSVGTDHDTESEDRDNDNVFVDNTSDIYVKQSKGGLDTRELWLQNRKEIDRKRLRHKSSPHIDENKKNTHVGNYRSLIQSDV